MKLRRGRTERERGEGASQTWKVDEKEKEKGNWVSQEKRERANKGGQLSKSAQQHSSHSCSDPGSERREVQPTKGENNKNTTNSLFLFSPLVNNLKTPWEGKGTGRKRHQRASAAKDGFGLWRAE